MEDPRHDEQQAYESAGHGHQPGADPAYIDSDRDARNWAVWAHLSGAIMMWVGFSFLGPLVIWLIKKDDHPFIEDQAREALNFHILTFIVLMVCIPLIFCGIGIIAYPVVWILGIVFGIVAAVSSNKGEAYRYPLNFRLIQS